MAHNYLPLSPSYCASTPESIQRLDDAVAQILSTNYKVPKGQQKELFAKLIAEHAGLTAVRINSRVRVFRTAFAVLTGHAAATHKEDVKKGYASAAGLIAFRQDGITTWEQVVELLKQKEVAQTTARRDPLEGVSATHVIVRRDDLEALVRESVDARARLEEAMSRIEHVERALAELKPVAVEEVKISDLRAQVAEPVPAVPTVLSTRLALVALLPKTSTYRHVGREVRYTDVFLERLLDMPVRDRDRVIERVRWISEDKSVSSLQIKPFGPPSEAAKYGGKPYSARASREVRIIFKPNGQLEFADIRRKGDIPGTSEA